MERSYRTWQGRLPQELRLRKMTTLQEANGFLRQEYQAEFNRRFAVTAAASRAKSCLGAVPAGVEKAMFESPVLSQIIPAVVLLLPAVMAEPAHQGGGRGLCLQRGNPEPFVLGRLGFTIENNGLYWTYPHDSCTGCPFLSAFSCAFTNVDQVWHRFANVIPSASVRTFIRRKPVPGASVLS